MFGGITALFSGLAFAGLISTLIMQRQELSLQREELSLTRNEFAMQRFEAVFFGLLRLFNEHTSMMERSYLTGSLRELSAKTEVGASVVKYYVGRLPSQITSSEGNSEAAKIDGATFLKVQIAAYESSYATEFEPNLGPYFRLLYNIMRHIDASDQSNDAKQKYAKIVRAYLNSSDVKLLMFHASSKYVRNFSKMIEKYSLLKHLRPEDAKANPALYFSLDEKCFEGRRFGIEN